MIPTSAYNLPLVRLNCFRDTLLDRPGYYHSKGVTYLFRPRNDGSGSRLIVNFNGAYSANILSRAVFRGYNYEIKGADILCICDALMLEYPHLRLAWYLDTACHAANAGYRELIEAISSIKSGYDEIIFTGSSGGGLPAVRMAAVTKQTAIVANPQLYPERYFYYKDLISGLAGDSLVPFDIEQHIKQCSPGRLVIYQNNHDTHHLKEHVLPFWQFLVKNNIHNVGVLSVFDHLEFLGAADAHGNPYPRGAKHASILADYIEASSSCSFNLSCIAAAYYRDGFVFASCDLVDANGIGSECADGELLFAFYLLKDGVIIAERGYNPCRDCSFSLRQYPSLDLSRLSVKAFAVIAGRFENKVFSVTTVRQP